MPAMTYFYDAMLECPACGKRTQSDHSTELLYYVEPMEPAGRCGMTGLNSGHTPPGA